MRNSLALGSFVHLPSSAWLLAGTASDPVGAHKSIGGWLHNDDYIVKTEPYTSENKTWNRWGLPDGETAITQGAMWGTYLSQQMPEFKVTVWDGITDTSTDQTDTEGDVVDGGAGNDILEGGAYSSEKKPKNCYKYQQKHYKYRSNSWTFYRITRHYFHKKYQLKTAVDAGRAANRRHGQWVA